MIFLLNLRKKQNQRNLLISYYIQNSKNIDDNYVQNLLKSVKGCKEFDESYKSLITLISSIKIRQATRIKFNINENIPFENWFYLNSKFIVKNQNQYLNLILKNCQINHLTTKQIQYLKIKNNIKKKKYDKSFESEETSLQSNLFLVNQKRYLIKQKREMKDFPKRN
ncbi:unnamed protein product [Paramecium pentaurelia]|uniref:Uncharacterized protein n=1 Tax=Paramecium pentaurelia TaxID=43138 RepID=A0A8S1UX93_9CILI|nr:unnamed protein product [Paramecium pentaurelia]